jgi:hypothetical protein
MIEKKEMILHCFIGAAFAQEARITPAMVQRLALYLGRKQ